jgi:hypothetical protein
MYNDCTNKYSGSIDCDVGCTANESDNTLCIIDMCRNFSTKDTCEKHVGTNNNCKYDEITGVCAVQYEEEDETLFGTVPALLFIIVICTMTLALVILIIIVIRMRVKKKKPEELYEETKIDPATAALRNDGEGAPVRTQPGVCVCG